jgi:multicomponent Na+:H+ antiporter subunit E
MTTIPWKRANVLHAARYRLPLLGMLWWAFAEGSWYGLPIAIVGVAASFAASLTIAPHPMRLRLSAVPGFIPFFVWQSVRGGVDVALRALKPSLPIAPGFYAHRLGVREGAPRVVMTALVSVFPGTLSAALDGDVLRVHVLDRTMNVEGSLALLERRVSLLFPD